MTLTELKQALRQPGKIFTQVTSSAGFDIIVQISKTDLIAELDFRFGSGYVNADTGFRIVKRDSGLWMLPEIF